MGDNTVLHAGVKLGGPGYEFKYLPGGGVLDVAHCGGVTIGADVMLFENVTVHRAVYPWDETVVGDECRVNAQSHIDHGVKLGRRVKVCAGCVISGRVEAGDGVKFGPGRHRVQPPDRRGRRPGAAGQRGVQGRPRRSGCLRQLRRGPCRPPGGGEGRRPPGLTPAPAAYHKREDLTVYDVYLNLPAALVRAAAPVAAECVPVRIRLCLRPPYRPHLVLRHSL